MKFDDFSTVGDFTRYTEVRQSFIDPDLRTAISDKLADLREYEAWKSTGLLDGLPHDRAVKTAVLLENQRLLIDEVGSAWGDERLRFRRLSVPILRRVMQKVNLDVARARGEDFHSYFKVADYAYDDYVSDSKSVRSLDMEAAYTCVLVENISSNLQGYQGTYGDRMKLQGIDLTTEHSPGKRSIVAYLRIS